MKLNLIKPNAHYDLVHGKPVVLEKDNDGSVIYRYNIVEEYGKKMMESKESHIGWCCNEVRIYDKPTKPNIKKAIIRSLLDETAEFDLVNSYNKHQLGINKDANAVTRYKEYLQFTEDLDALLVKTLNIN